MRTTANINFIFAQEIKRVSILFNISEKIIFKDTVNCVIANINCYGVKGRLIEYQKRNPGTWKILHYRVNEDEIETFSLTRQKYKISISNLAFAGFILFWEILIFGYSERLKFKKTLILIKNIQSLKKKYIKEIEYFKRRLNIILKE